MDHGLAGFGIELVVQGDSPKAVEPCERPFDNPPQRDDVELLRAFVRSEHDLNVAAERPSYLFLQLIAPISTLGDNLLQPRELMCEFLQRRFRALAVVDGRLVDKDGQRKPKRVGHDLILTPLHLLVTVYAALLVDVLAGLDTPRVDDADTRALVPAEQDAQLLPQRVHDILKDTLAFPLRKVVEHNVVQREVFRGHTPLAAGLVDVEYAVHNVSE